MDSSTMQNQEDGSASGRLRPPFWGAGFAFAAFLSAIRFADGEGAGGADDLLILAASVALGGIFAAVAVAATTVREQRSLFEIDGRGSVFALTACSAAACIGAAGVLPWYVPSVGFPLWASGLLCAVFGASMTLIAMIWGDRYARLEPEQLLPNSAVAAAVGGLGHGMQEVAGFTGLGWALVPLFVIASALCARRAGGEQGPTGTLGEGAGDSSAGSVARESLKTAATLLWMPLVGACLGSFIFGLTWDPVVSAERDMQAAHLIPGMTAIGPVAMTLVVAVLSARYRGTSPLRLFNQAVYPVAVMLLLVIPVMNQALPDARFAMNVLSAASFAVVALCVWCNMAAAGRCTPFNSAFVFSSGFTLFGLCFAAGLWAIKELGTGGRTLCLVLFAIYLALIAVWFALGNRDERTERVAARAADDTRSYIHRRCDKLATAFELSPREADVLYYLARGYSHVYIAKKLFISENTVRTHVRHIYGKLHVASREELIDLVDEAQ